MPLHIVKPLVGYLLAAALCMTAIPAFSAPTKVDTTKRARVATDKKADLPGAVEMKKDEVVQDRRFSTGELRDKKEAIVGERRSPMEAKKTRDKKMAPKPELIEEEKIPRKDNAWNHKESKYSTSEDAYRSKVATRFQDKIGDASPFPAPTRTVIDQRTTFSKVNRFAFRKNADQSVTVSTAGSEAGTTDASDRSSLSAGSATPVSRRR